MRRKCTIPELLHLQHVDVVCDVRRRSAVSGMPRLQYEERSVQHQEGRNCSTKRRLCSVRGGVQYLKGTSAVLSQGVWCEKKVYGKKECHICSTWTENMQYKDKLSNVRRKLCRMMRECTISEGYICSRRTGLVL